MASQHESRDYTYPEVLVMFIVGAVAAGVAHVALVQLAGRVWGDGLSVGIIMLVGTSGFFILDRRHGRQPRVGWKYIIVSSIIGAAAAIFLWPLLSTWILGN